MKLAEAEYPGSATFQAPALRPVSGEGVRNAPFGDPVFWAASHLADGIPATSLNNFWIPVLEEAGLPTDGVDTAEEYDSVYRILMSRIAEFYEDSQGVTVEDICSAFPEARGLTDPLHNNLWNAIDSPRAGNTPPANLDAAFAQMTDAARIFFDWNYDMRQNLRPHNILCMGLVFEAPEYWILRTLTPYRALPELISTGAFIVEPDYLLPPASGYTATLSAVSGDRRLAVLTLCNSGERAGQSVNGSENFNMLVAWDGLRYKVSIADRSPVHQYSERVSCEVVQDEIDLYVEYFQNWWRENYGTRYSGLSTTFSGDYRSGLTN